MLAPDDGVDLAHPLGGRREAEANAARQRRALHGVIGEAEQERIALRAQVRDGEGAGDGQRCGHGALGCQTNTLGGIIDPDAKQPTSLGRSGADPSTSLGMTNTPTDGDSQMIRMRSDRALGDVARALVVRPVLFAALALGMPMRATSAQSSPLDSLAARVDPYVAKPRVIVMTDIANEPDDQMSMVRLLVYSNQLDIEGLVATTSTWMKRDGAPRRDLHKVIAAYGKVQPNLLDAGAGLSRPPPRCARWS